MKTFSHYNPTWEIKVWFPTVIGKTNHGSWVEQKTIHTGKDWFPELETISCNISSFDFENIGVSNDETEVHKSDILRWYLLNKEGGFWSDFDILYQKPFEKSEIPLDVPRVLFKTNTYHSIGFFGSEKNDPVMKLVLSEARESIRRDKNYQSGGRIALEKVINNDLKENDSFYAEQQVVYPFQYNKIANIFTSTDLWKDPKTIGCHWFAGSSKSNEIENGLLSHKNCDQPQSFFKAIL